MNRKFSITSKGLNWYSYCTEEPYDLILELLTSRNQHYHHGWVIVEVMKEKGVPEKETLEALTWLWRREFISDERD